MPEATVAEMKRRLAALDPVELAIEDESALHAGHAERRAAAALPDDSSSSAAFAGQPRVARHRPCV